MIIALLTLWLASAVVVSLVVARMLTAGPPGRASGAASLLVAVPQQRTTRTEAPARAGV